MVYELIESECSNCLHYSLMSDSNIILTYFFKAPEGVGLDQRKCLHPNRTIKSIDRNNPIDYEKIVGWMSPRSWCSLYKLDENYKRKEEEHIKKECDNFRELIIKNNNTRITT